MVGPTGQQPQGRPNPPPHGPPPPHGAPQYGAPQYGAPQYGAPQHPQYGAPQYGPGPHGTGGYAPGPTGPNGPGPNGPGPGGPGPNGPGPNGPGPGGPGPNGPGPNGPGPNGPGPNGPGPNGPGPNGPGPGGPGPNGPGPGGYGPPPHGPGAYGPPPTPGPPPPARRSSAGKIIAIVVGVVVVLVVLAGFAVSQLFAGVADKVGGLTAGAGAGCDAVATADVNAALGGTYEVVALGGLGSIAGPALDSRILPDAPTCWAVESGDGGRLARVARYSGADAAQRFAAEKTAAMGASEDRGNGLTVSTEGYFAAETAAGDEAFCTSGDFIGSAGALVRRGELLVYVSTTAAGEGAASIPDIDFDSDKLSFGTDAANCKLAVALAEKVH